MSYKLNEKTRIDNMIDFSIIFNNKEIGVLNININEEDIFIRQIRIFEEYRRSGHAKNMIEYLKGKFKRNIGFCIATNSESAIKFWKKILEENKYIHVRGDIYKLIYQ